MRYLGPRNFAIMPEPKGTPGWRLVSLGTDGKLLRRDMSARAFPGGVGTQIFVGLLRVCFTLRIFQVTLLVVFSVIP